MSIRRYKSWDDARRELIDLCIEESAAPFRSTGVIATLPSRQHGLKHRVKGVFRFKSWEEAHRFDLDLLIEEACTPEKPHDS
jgi:hypothetical protein